MLARPPACRLCYALQGDRGLEAGALSFRNNFAMNQSLAGMPTR